MREKVKRGLLKDGEGELRGAKGDEGSDVRGEKK